MVVKILDDESEEGHLIDDEDDEVICIDWIKRWNKGFKEKNCCIAQGSLTLFEYALQFADGWTNWNCRFVREQSK